MIAVGMLGIAMVMVVADPLRGKLWVASLVLGALMVAVGLVVGGGQPEMVP